MSRKITTTFHMKNAFLFSLLTLSLLIITAPIVSAQWRLRDERGDTVPSYWPPTSGTYEPHAITIWFNHNTINQSFLCDYWDQGGYSPSDGKNHDNRIASVPTGVMAIDTFLIRNPGLVEKLRELGADSMIQYSTLTPCRDTLSFTRWGDTIRTPEFWNSFYVPLHDSSAITAVLVLDYLYGGTLINFAELVPMLRLDGCNYTAAYTNPGQFPDDPFWRGVCNGTSWDTPPPSQSNFYTSNYGIDLPQAWAICKGDRSIKVGVIDAGVDYDHIDFIAPGTAQSGTSGLGCAFCSFVDGNEYFNGQRLPGKATPNRWVSPTVNYLNYGEPHGTEVSGIIGATNHNESNVSSVAGQWVDEHDATKLVANSGVSMYAFKNDDVVAPNYNGNYFNAIIDATGSTTAPRQFKVDVVNMSWGTLSTAQNGSTVEGLYSEELRGAIDYAYRLGAVCVTSKGNDDQGTAEHYPSDYEYSKVIAVGNSWAVTDPVSGAWIPARTWTQPNIKGSNFGFGLDIMAPGESVQGPTPGNGYLLTTSSLYSAVNNHVTPPVWMESARTFANTSASAPQVTGVAALIFSENAIHRNSSFDQPLFPEDVQGLLCSTAADITFDHLNIGVTATGYDKYSGYGLLKAGSALRGMQSVDHYELRHCTTTGGTASAQHTFIQNFIVQAPSDGTAPLLDPTILPSPSNGMVGNEYEADMYKVVTTYTLPTSFVAGPVKPFAAAWGLGEKSTGWNGAQPMISSQNSSTYQTGYTRVAGNANANNQDIKFGNPLISVDLETFCYRVRKANAGPPVINSHNTPPDNWWPCSPGKVVYNFSVWGVLSTNGVHDDGYNISPVSSAITVHCEMSDLGGSSRVLIRYGMSRPEPVVLSIFDAVGRLVVSESEQTFGSADQTIYLRMDGAPSGTYSVQVRSRSGLGGSRFTFVK